MFIFFFCCYIFHMRLKVKLNVQWGASSVVIKIKQKTFLKNPFLLVFRLFPPDLNISDYDM